MAWSLPELTDALVDQMVDNSRYPQLAGQPMPTTMRDEMENSMGRMANAIYHFVESFVLEPGVIELTYQVKGALEDPMAGYLEDKIDDDTIKISDTYQLYVDNIPLATDTRVGGVQVGAQPFLYMQGNNLMLNAEASPTLVGGNDMVPTSRAVRLYVDGAISAVAGGGVGDMLKSTYDSGDNGVVDDSERLNNQLPSYYLSWTNATDTPTTLSGYNITDAYTDAEIDAFFEGESAGKKQVDWARITNQPSIPAISSAGSNRVLTSDGTATGIDAEPNLTFDGSTLTLLNGAELDQYGRNITVGSDIVGGWTSRTNLQPKLGGIVLPHYLTAEEDITVISFATDQSWNRLVIGGGNVDGNAFQEVKIYAADDTTTLTGTEVAVFDTSNLTLYNGVELDQYGRTITVGGDFGDYTDRTDATAKDGYIVTPHYTNAEESFLGLGLQTGSGNNIALIGGGSSDYNASTLIRFYTAEDATTTTGVIVGTFYSDGFHVDSISELTTDAGVTIESMLFEDNTILFNEVTAPTAPAANTGVLYMDSSDEHVYFQNSTTTFDLTSSGSGMVYPGAGIALSTGSAWDTSITDNSATWDAAQPGHANLTSLAGLTYASLSFVKMSAAGTFSLDTATYLTSETSHADVVVDGDFTSQGIMLRGVSAGVYSIVGSSSAVDTVETTLTDDDTHLPTSGAVYAAIAGSGGMVYPGVGIALSTGSAWDTSITDNSANWNTAFGWGDHDGLYDTTGTASGLITTHETTYNHTQFQTAYTHSTLTTGNPHNVDEMVYPGAGIALSTGSAWGTSITNNSANWDTAYTHSTLTTGNPHSIGYADISDFNTGVSTYETSHATVVTAANGVDNRIAVFTGTYTVEGNTNFTYNTTNNLVTVGAAGDRVEIGTGTTQLHVENSAVDTIFRLTNYGTTAGLGNTFQFLRYGGIYGASAAAPTNAIIFEHLYYLYDGTSLESSGYFRYQVDGAVATGNFDTEWVWHIRNGTTASELAMELRTTGLEIANGLQVAGSAMNFTGLGSNDTEDHVIAINDSTGLLTKRSIASIGSGLSFGTTTQIPYMNVGGTDFIYTADFTFDGSYLSVNGSIQLDSLSDSIIFNAASTAVIGTTGLGNLIISSGGSTAMQFIGTDVQMGNAIDLLPNTDKSSDIGDPSYYFDNAYFDRVYIDQAGCYIDITGSGATLDMTFTSTLAGTVSLNNLGGGAWDVTSNLITPATAGDDVRLVNGEQLQFQGSGVYLTSSSTTAGYINVFAGAGIEHFRVGGSGLWMLYGLYKSSSAWGAVDIGQTGTPFDDIFVDTIHITSINTTAGDYYLTWDSTTNEVRRGASTSDIRLKRDPISIENAVEKVMLLDGFTYNLNKLGQEVTGLDGRMRAGLSAQDLQEVLPEVVGYIGQTDYYQVDYNGVIALLVNAVKEQQLEIEELKRLLN